MCLFLMFLLFFFHIWLTFGTDVSTRNAHLDAVVLHLHLVTGARSHAGAVVHHKIIWKNNSLHMNTKCMLATHRNTQYR